MFRDVIEKVSEDAGHRIVAERSVSGLVTERIFSDWKFKNAQTAKVKKTVAWLPRWLKTMQSDLCAQLQ